LKSGNIVREFIAKDGKKIIIRYPKWDDLNNFVFYLNNLFEESEQDQNFDILFEKKYTMDEWLKWLAELLVRIETDKEIYLVAESDGFMAGFTYITRGSVAYERHHGILGLSVAKELRDQGIGTELIRTALNEARKAGLASVELAAFHNNLRAIELYEKLGFERVGRIPKKTQRDGRYFDDIIMSIDL